VCPSKCHGLVEGLPESNPCCDWFRYLRNNESVPADQRRRPVNCWPIPVDQDDHAFGIIQDGGRQVKECIEFTRSQISTCGLSDGINPVQFNEVTHFVDASSVYGSTDIHSNILRAGKKGLLRLNQFTDASLPFHTDSCQAGLESRPPTIFHPRSFQAGDIRVNENPGLQTFHTLWVKEHNNIAKEIGRLFPDKSDEDLFQETRRYLTAEYQSAVYTEFLPIALGQAAANNFGFLDQLSMYSTTTRPDIFNEFSTAAFRFGHSLITNEILMAAMDLPSQNTEKVDLADHFFNTEIMRKKFMEKLLMGMTQQEAARMDSKMVSAVTEKLFRRPDEIFGSDLAARNIQRGRDHEIASYSMVREECGLGGLSDTFGSRPNEFTDDVWWRFSQLYSSPLDIELFPGGMAETSVGGGLLGPVFTCLIGRQFANLKDGDRYFFTHSNIGEESVMCDKERIAIQRRKFRDLLCDVMKGTSGEPARVARNPFLVVNGDTNPLEPCDQGLVNKLVAEDLCLFQGEEPNPRPVKPTQGGRDVLVLAGGFNGTNVLTSVELYSPSGTCNLDLPSLPTGLYGVNVFTYDDAIYACGGAFSTKGSDCYFLQPSAAHWEVDKNMKFKYPRQMASMTQSSGSGVVFVSGGINQQRQSSTSSEKDGMEFIEYLDRFTGRWEVGPTPLLDPKMRHCMIMENDMDFIVIGGFGTNLGTQVQRFDEKGFVWNSTDTTWYNDRHSCAWIPGKKNEVLIVGDRRRPSIYNTQTRKERLIRGEVNFSRGFAGLVNINNELYSVGGEFSTPIVEKFDAQTELFTSVGVPNLKYGRSRFGYTTLPSTWFQHLGCT